MNNNINEKLIGYEDHSPEEQKRALNFWLNDNRNNGCINQGSVLDELFKQEMDAGFPSFEHSKMAREVSIRREFFPCAPSPVIS